MPISTRNRPPGKVKTLDVGAVTTTVEVERRGGDLVT